MDNQELQKKVFKDPYYFIAFGCGSGLSPTAPGTMGSLVGVVLYLLFGHMNIILYLVFVVALLVFGIWLTEKVSQELGETDPQGIVLDEIVGYLVAMMTVPMGFLWLLLGFILFRVFDIVKPWPIPIAEKELKGGMAIMMDDVLAGVYTALVLLIIRMVV